MRLWSTITRPRQARAATFAALLVLVHVAHTTLGVGGESLELAFIQLAASQD